MKLLREFCSRGTSARKHIFLAIVISLINLFSFSIFLLSNNLKCLFSDQHHTLIPSPLTHLSLSLSPFSLFISPAMLCGSDGSVAGRKAGCSAAASPGNRQVSGCQPAGTDVCSGPAHTHKWIKTTET